MGNDFAKINIKESKVSFVDEQLQLKKRWKCYCAFRLPIDLRRLQANVLYYPFDLHTFLLILYFSKKIGTTTVGSISIRSPSSSFIHEEKCWVLLAIGLDILSVFIFIKFQGGKIHHFELFEYWIRFRLFLLRVLSSPELVVVSRSEFNFIVHTR